MQTFILISALLFLAKADDRAPVPVPEGENNVRELEDRVVDGVPASIRYQPWIASLQTKNNQQHFCGGSLVDPEWVLTATHCVRGKTASGIQIQVGTTHLNDGGVIR